MPQAPLGIESNTTKIQYYGSAPMFYEIGWLIHAESLIQDGILSFCVYLRPSQDPVSSRQLRRQESGLISIPVFCEAFVAFHGRRRKTYAHSPYQPHPLQGFLCKLSFLLLFGLIPRSTEEERDTSLALVVCPDSSVGPISRCRRDGPVSPLSWRTKFPSAEKRKKLEFLLGKSSILHQKKPEL